MAEVRRHCFAETEPAAFVQKKGSVFLCQTWKSDLSLSPNCGFSWLPVDSAYVLSCSIHLLRKVSAAVDHGRVNHGEAMWPW